MPLVAGSLTDARPDGEAGRDEHGVVRPAADEHVVPQSFVMRTKHEYAVDPDRPVTVYDVAPEMPVVTVDTVPVASLVGSGHDDSTVDSVQNASSFVTVGSVTDAHAKSIVTPPAGAARVGVGEDGGAAEHAVVRPAADEHVVPQSFVMRTKHEYAVDPDRPVTVYDVAPEMPVVTVDTVPVASLVGSGHDDSTVDSVQNASSFVTVGSVTDAHAKSIVTPPAGAARVGVGEDGGAAEHAVVRPAADEHVVPQSFVMRTKHEYAVDPDRPVTVYDVAPEMPVVTVDTVPVASLVGSGHDDSTVDSVQNASSFVTVGSVTDAHAKSIVTPPAGAARVGVGEDGGAAEHAVVRPAADEHVVPQSFVMRTKHEYAVDPDRPVTVYDVAPEMPVVTVDTVPVASLVGSGHDDSTVDSVQNASSFVTVGSVTDAHAKSIVTPPAGAARVGVGEDGGAAEHAVVWGTPSVAQVSPQSLSVWTQQV